MISFEVPGLPEQKGSIDFKGMRGGKPIMTSSNKNLAGWASKAKVIAKTARRGTPSIQGAVAVHLTFSFPRPKDQYGTGRNAGQLKDSAPEYMITRPDIDKLTRACLDALTAGGVYLDDNRVVELQVNKQYAHEKWASRPGSVGAHFLVMELEAKTRALAA
jgi:Holliday junction resolvase RusA-like endonuclease